MDSWTSLASIGGRFLPGKDIIQKYYVDRLGARFWVSSLVPSILFLIASSVALVPFSALPTILTYITQANFGQVFLSILAILLVIMIISLWLHIFQTQHMRLYSGDTLIALAPFARKSQQRKASILIAKINTLEQRIRALEKAKRKSEKTLEELDRLRDEYYSTVFEYDQNYPPGHEDIRATRFGNILKAAESYPAYRYGINPSVFWTRLIHVIPTAYKQMLDDVTDEIFFLINLSSLSVLFAAINISLILYSLFNGANASSLNISKHLMSTLIALAGSLIFYKTCLNSVTSLANLSRSVYDLFRLQLLEQLKLSLPSDSIEEFHIWKNLGELIVLGHLSLEFTSLKYNFQAEDV